MTHSARRVMNIHYDNTIITSAKEVMNSPGGRMSVCLSVNKFTQ